MSVPSVSSSTVACRRVGRVHAHQAGSDLGDYCLDSAGNTQRPYVDASYSSIVDTATAHQR